MARKEITYTRPGTVAHGYIIENGKAVFVSYEFDGSYLHEKGAENRARREHDKTFSLDRLSYYKKVYTMPVEEFVKHATLEDINEM